MVVAFGVEFAVAVGNPAAVVAASSVAAAVPVG